MAGSRRRRNEPEWSGILERALEHLRVGVVACDEALRIRGCTARAKQILERFALARRFSMAEPIPTPIAAAISAGPRPASPVRVEAPDGRGAVYVSALRGSELPADVVVLCLRDEAERDAELRRTLQERYSTTAREFQLIALLRRGHSTDEIATTLGLTHGTVRVYLHNLFDSMGVHSRAELVALIERIRSGES